MRAVIFIDCCGVMTIESSMQATQQIGVAWYCGVDVLVTSVAEPELPGAANFRGLLELEQTFCWSEPDTHFLRRLRLRLHLLVLKKRKALFLSQT